VISIASHLPDPHAIHQISPWKPPGSPTGHRDSRCLCSCRVDGPILGALLGAGNGFHGGNFWNGKISWDLFGWDMMGYHSPSIWI